MPDDHDPAREAREAGTVLVMDDAEPIRFVVRQMLEDGGCRVLEAADGEAGLELVEAVGDSLDLVLTDLHMPGIDGGAVIEVLSRFRPDLPVIGMSGRPTTEPAPVLPAGQPLRVLPKPFARETLAQLVRDAINEARASCRHARRLNAKVAGLRREADRVRAAAVSLGVSVFLSEAVIL